MTTLSDCLTLHMRRGSSRERKIFTGWDFWKGTGARDPLPTRQGRAGAALFTMVTELGLVSMARTRFCDTLLLYCIKEGTMTAEGNPVRVQVIHAEHQPQNAIHLNSWLEQLVTRNGSDLLLVPNAPPLVRVEGVLAGIGDSPLTGEESESAG